MAALTNFPSVTTSVITTTTALNEAIGKFLKRAREADGAMLVNQYVH